MLVLNDQHLNEDRRAFPRLKVSRPCKVHDPRSGKYLAGSTRDLSCGGALIEIARPLEIGPGETLHIGVAQKRRQMLLRADDMLEMRVVRALRTPQGTTVLAGRWVGQASEAQPMRLAA